ncbi:MAG: DUF5675 family protein [Bacteroidota bacterium]
MKRSSYGTHDTLGKLFINGEFAAFSLESPKAKCLEAGSYNLCLRSEGGRHASYWYRFGNMHKGMLFLQSDKDGVYPYVCIGNLGSDANGSILLGTQFNKEEEESAKREVWYSENAYTKVYPQIAGKLAEGESLSLTIS